MDRTQQSTGDGSQPIARAITASIGKDIALNTVIPLSCYLLSKRLISSSEVTALLAATAFPILQTVHGLTRHHGLNPVSITVLLGILTSLVALFVGGDPRLLLVRESFSTALFGIVCLLSLPFPRPVMFYFARYFIAGEDSTRRTEFDRRARDPRFRQGFRIVTAVWGVVYVGEFVVRAALIYTVPAVIVLPMSPILLGAATIAAVAWTFSFRRRLMESAGLTAM